MTANPIVALYLRALDFPRLCLAVLALLAVVAGVYTQRFSFDASSDTLVVKGDPDLAAYRDVSSTFKGDDFLVLTFTPKHGEALSEVNLETLRALLARLESVEHVAGTFSILNVPLLKSPPVPLAELAEGFKTLDSADVDLDMAKEELRTSPLFRELLITADGNTTAIRIDLEPDEALKEVQQRRNALDEIAEPTPQQAFAREQVEEEYRLAREAFLERRDRLIAEIREVRHEFDHLGVLYLGGVPMIAADMIDFVKGDLVIFGGSVLLLLMLCLFAFFRNLRWVLLPIAGSALTILMTTGFLGFYGKPATVISSNYVSLLAIITISLNIHLIVRYREVFHLAPDASVSDLVRQTMVSKFAPCLYNTLTTMAAFGSLMASSIVPVEDFGWMMCIGILIGFVLTFFFFPCVLLLLPLGNPGITLNEELALTRVLSFNARWRPGIVVAGGVALAIVAWVGIARVSLDNRFIDYFKADTEINAGMRFIDRYLGGTVPFDVVLTFPAYEPLTGQNVFGDEDGDDFGDDFAEVPSADEFVDDFADEFSGDSADPFPERYWFTRDKLDRVTLVHRYLESRPEVGKVLSLTTMEDLAKEFTDGRPLSGPEIAGILGMLPPHLIPELIAPYAHPETGRLRINARVIESGPSFDRSALVADIQQQAVETAGFKPEEVQVTGMLVLFNSMLNKLFSSQVDTLAYVLLATFVMFLILMRSVLYAVLGLLPNILAASLVIAFMGYAGIPLDMMTITIASISIGIGVDDAIHYLHRFKEEFDQNGDARLAVAWSHATIGRAMYFTSLTIIVGFSVLCFSNFVPTILFGLLVAVAMVLALVANLSLLPALLVLCKGKQRTAVSEVVGS